jgi:cytochrome c biogenesis protein CcmG/thiol:disulfide interchange protein DsbE
MKTNKVVRLVVTIAVVVALGVVLDRYGVKRMAAQQASPEHPMAPSFTLTDIFGQKLGLDQYRGKVILLDFWATWCGPCRLEIPGFIQLQKRYGSQGLQVIGLSEDSDGVGTVRDFYKRVGMDYRAALDNGKVGLLYGGIFGLPTTFLIGRDGRIYLKLPGAVDATYFEPGIKTLLAASPQTEVKNFPPLAGSESAEVETPAEANPVVPGIDLSKLTKPELAQYERTLSNQPCTCGCKVSVLQCRRADPGCLTSRDLARKTLRKLNKPAT